MATTADRIKATIAEYTAQIEELREKKAAAEREYDQLVTLPKYIDDSMETLVKHFGPNAEWEAIIREALTENLTSTPVCENEAVWQERGVCEDHETVTYHWKEVRIAYRSPVERESWRSSTPEPYFVCAYDDGDDAEDVYCVCVNLRRRRKWDDCAELSLIYMPILVAYLDGNIS